MCDCIEKVNEALAEHNTQLNINMSLSGRPSRIILDTIKLPTKQRGKKKMVVASYCPFCGEPYQEQS